MSESVFNLEDFNYDNETKKIISCPSGNICIESKFISAKRYHYARFESEQCSSCDFIKQCPVKIKNKYSIARIFKKSEPRRSENLKKKIIDENNVIDKSLEKILKMQIEMAVGSINKTKKGHGKKYEDGVICYDGDYLEANNLREEDYYGHGYGKAYYEDGSLEYEGYYVYGHPHGNGKYYYRNGQVKWEGIFEAIPGFGAVSIEAITTAEGYADRDGRIKYGKKYNVSGKLEYEGEFNLGIPNGKGKLYDDNQTLIFVGEFKNGKPRGENKLEKILQNDAQIDYKASGEAKNQHRNNDFIIEETGLKYVGESDEVNVPESIDKKIIDKIAPEGFAHKRVKKVVLPNTVKVIGTAAFANCSELAEIIIPDSVTNIEASAFMGCSSLVKIELSDNIIEIGSYAFDQCSNLKEIKLPKEINYIGAYAFSETGLEKITLPKGIKYLANSLFYDCRNLSEVILKDGVETIGNYTFANCVNLNKINLTDSIKRITYASFDGCVSLTSIHIPINLCEMDETSFSNCVNLQQVETNDINKKIVKFDIEKETAKSFGLPESGLFNKPNYDTIYNMLRSCMSKQLKVIPINNQVEKKKDDYVALLEEGVSLKHLGKYEEAKEIYIKAIHIDNTHPTGYYNLAKVLYILGDYKASAKAYKASFERGMCELQQSMGYDEKRASAISLYAHLGHALLDQENKEGQYSEVMERYEETIDPLKMKGYKPNRGQFKKDDYNDYDKMCIAAAKTYLEE